MRVLARASGQTPQPRLLASASGAESRLPGSSYADLVPYVTMLMLRNFSTDTWVFKTDGRVSAPGCVIASPSRPGDPFSDQDYVNSWVRDSALCTLEAAHADVPFLRTGLLDDYVTFSRTCQVNAHDAGRDGHACFHVDGSVREWSIQSDGPALRVGAVLDFYDKLSPAAQQVARQLVADDVSYLLTAYREPTMNLWEETRGFHFFTRAVQKRCFERVAAQRDRLGLAVSVSDVLDAAKDLDARLGDHWTGDGYYRSTVDGSGVGGDVDSSTVFGAVYAGLDPRDPRLLSTAAVVWDSFRERYPINDADAARGMGPLIGRYPEDTYDGDVAEPPNVGHPWPLCTALFAQYYYQLAASLRQAGTLRVDDLTRRCYAQVGFVPPAGDYAAGTAEFADALAKLDDAGDRMLAAVLYHSDHLELSEQFDRDSGYEKSVRNLTWSYAAFLSAVRVKGG